MAQVAGTLARVNPKTGVAEHKHGAFGWHWASAGHRDDGSIHKAAKVEEPTYAEGMTATQKANYLKAVKREDGHVSRIASVSAAKPHEAVLVKA